MYAISFRAIELTASIGIHDFEQAAPQRVLVDLDIVLPARQDGADAIATVFDYDQALAAVKSAAVSGHVNLQEKLCEDIIARLSAFDAVRALQVRTCKPDVYADVAGVGCRMRWIRDGVDRVGVSELLP
ncbi:MAG: dihydroneopterin aldolase [Glycocaulis sp.]